MRISEVSEPGFYWRLENGKWDVVHLERNSDPDRLDGTSWLVSTAGWDVPETDADNVDTEFVGPLTPPGVLT